MNFVDLYFITHDETYEKFEEFCFTLPNSNFIPSTGDYMNLHGFEDLVVCHYSERRDLAQEQNEFKELFDIVWVVGQKWWRFDKETKRVTVEIDLHGEDDLISKN